MKKWFFVSDLHLLARRSQADRYGALLDRAASQASRFVLGGDIFDFRWAAAAVTAPPLAAGGQILDFRTAASGDMAWAVREAVGWLQRLLRRHPQCQFHLVLGNHDYHWAFLCRLDGLADEFPHFHWHPYYLRLGKYMFLHGDVVQRKMTPERLAVHRIRWHHRHRPARLRSHLYDLWQASRLPRVLGPLVFPKRRVARRILAYLQRIGHGPEQGVRHVYFGHIHRGFSGYRYRGLTFHNSPPAVRGHRFGLLEVAQDGDPS